MKHVPPPTGEPLSDVSAAAVEQLADAAKKLESLRKEAEAEIERLLAFLDEADGDADREDDDRESDVDEENEHVDDEDGGDTEPSLGSSIDHGAGTSYGNVKPLVHGLDLEDEHDGREPSLSGVTVEPTYDDRDLEFDLSDNEPSLGWPELLGDG